MPEGPEHFKAAVLINNCCKDRVFSGKIVKSAINIKNPDVEFDVDQYTIHAKARGKELMLILNEHESDFFESITYKIKTEEEDTVKVDEADTVEMDMMKKDTVKIDEADTVEMDMKNSKTKCIGIVNKKEKLDVLPKQIKLIFQFGMSGKFEFKSKEEKHKHAHLMFYTDDKKRKMVLSYVDVRRFGRWRLSDVWSKGRGPDPVYEYKEFRENVLQNLEEKVFSKPICEVLHNQKFFNGLGNYLRAEILYRSSIPPFEMARTVLKKLVINKGEPCRKEKHYENNLDILEYCSVVPYEVMMLHGAGYDPSDNNSDYKLFQQWLQCYYQPGINNLIDHDGRTIWFKGEAGPLAPKNHKAKSRHIRREKVPQTNMTATKPANPVKTGRGRKRKSIVEPVNAVKKTKIKSRVTQKNKKSDMKNEKQWCAKPIRRHSLRLKSLSKKSI